MFHVKHDPGAPGTTRGGVSRETPPLGTSRSAGYLLDPRHSVKDSPVSFHVSVAVVPVTLWHVSEGSEAPSAFLRTLCVALESVQSTWMTSGSFAVPLLYRQSPTASFLASWLSLLSTKPLTTTLRPATARTMRRYHLTPRFGRVGAI